MTTQDASSGGAATPRLSRAVLALVRHPVRRLLLRWNWKSALLSAAIRATIFFSITLTAGTGRAVKAMLVEAVYAALASGFYGAITQNLRNAQPQWMTGLLLSVLLPLGFLLAQYAVHWAVGTPRLAANMLVSLCFAAVSSLFNWYAMRRGTLLTGAEGHTLANDLRMLPYVIVGFTTALPRMLWRSLERAA